MGATTAARAARSGHATSPATVARVASTLLVGSGTREQVELWDIRMAPHDGYEGEPHPAGTRELLLVIEGELTLEVDGVEYRVPEGGATAFVADRPHAYRNTADLPLRLSMTVVHSPAARLPHPPPAAEAAPA